MGQCYTTYLKVKFEDEQGAVKAVQKRLEGQGVDIELLGRETGLDYNTTDGILRHYYSNWENGHKWTPTTDPEVLSGDFNASYSWESTMIEVFQLIAPFLQDGSELKIYPDSNYDYLVVKDGKAEWIH